MLRVISGSAKGHKLKTVKGTTTRPTSDRVKESLFNIITGYIPEAAVLDIYAGTGNLGIEALSRGASRAVFVDRSAESCAVIRENLQHTKFVESSKVLTTEAKEALERLSHQKERFDVVFLDPPYHKNLIEETLKYIEKNDIISEEGIIVAERDADDEVPEYVGNLKRVRDQKYGDTVLSFYKNER